MRSTFLKGTPAGPTTSFSFVDDVTIPKMVKTSALVAMLKDMLLWRS